MTSTINRLGLSIAVMAAWTLPAGAQSPSYGGPNSATINGALLGADVQKSNAERAQNVEAFRQALRGFPRDALTVTVTNIAPLPGDPTAINVQYKLGVSPEWLARLRASLSALAVIKYRGGDHPEPLGSYVDRAFNQLAMSGRAGNHWGARFCIYGGGASDCYLLPDGDYGQATLLPATPLGRSTPIPSVTVQLFAADGTPTSRCLVRRLDKSPNVIGIGGGGQIGVKSYGQTGFTSLNGNASFFLGADFVLVADDVNGALLITTKEADFARSTKMVFRPVLAAVREPGQRPFLDVGALSSPHGYAVPDITTTPTIKDACSLS